MENSHSQWALASEDWQALCRTLDSVTAAERPYEAIPIGKTDTGDIDAYVSEPYPEAYPNHEFDEGEVFSVPDEDVEPQENNIKVLPATVATPIEKIVARLRKQAFTLSEPHPDLTTGFQTGVLTAEKSAAVFVIQRDLERDELELYSQFKELMATLGHIDSPEQKTWGDHVAPVVDDMSDHDVDLGMAAVAYRFVEDPHTYWGGCDTLDDYIDMCVSNGADREEMEARDKYTHHFHPDTRVGNLTNAQEQAIKEWRAALREAICPYVSLGEVVLRDSISNVWFDKDGSGGVEYTVSVGDTINPHE